MKSLILGMFLVLCPVAFADVLVVATVQDNANDRESDLFIELAFEKEYPNIDLQFFARPTPTYKNKISDWISAESDADIFYWFGGKQFNQFAEAGYLANLNDVWQKIVPQPQFNPTVFRRLVWKIMYSLFPHQIRVGVFTTTKRCSKSTS